MKLLGTRNLETERLILRKYELSDAEDMYNNWGTDPNCNKYLLWELHKNIEETKEILRDWKETYKEDKFKWIIVLKDSNIAIGGIDVVRLNKKDGICEIGYCIGSKFWNKGYTTETLNKVLDYLFNECELRNRAYNRETKQLENLVAHSITKEEFNKKNS